MADSRGTVGDTAIRRSRRRVASSSLTGIAAGAALLAAVAGFAIGLPEVSDGAKASGVDLPALPDRLDARMVALSALTPTDAEVTTDEEKALVARLATAAGQSDEKATKKIADLYGAARVRAYIDASAVGDRQQQTAPAQMSVTMVPGETGLVIPSGPFDVDQQGSRYELTRVGGHRCAVAWRIPTDPDSGAVVEGEVPASSYQTECRAARDGISYDVYATGLAPKEVASYLDALMGTRD